MTRISNREEFGRKIFSRTVKTLRQNVKSWQHFDLSMIEGVSTKWLFVRERSWIVIGGLFEIGLLGPLNSISFPRLKILQLLGSSAIFSSLSGESRRKMVKGVPAQQYSNPCFEASSGRQYPIKVWFCNPVLARSACPNPPVPLVNSQCPK